MGGVHAAAVPEEALEHVDVVVKGEGERAVLDIVENKIESGVVSWPYFKNLDEVPMPARHLIDMDFYSAQKQIAYCIERPKIGALITSRAARLGAFFVATLGVIILCVFIAPNA